MSSKSKLNAKSLPHVPGYTVWENANGFGRPGYLPGSGNQYVDTVGALCTATKQEARIIACVVLLPLAMIAGFVWGQQWFGGKGAVIGIFVGAASAATISYALGLFLVRLAAALAVLVPVGVFLWLAGGILIDMWHR